MGGKASFTPAFDRWRFYADGTESGSSPYGGAAENANVTVNVGSGDQQIHLRCRVQETGGAAGATTDDWGLQYQVDGAGGWTSITDASTRLRADTGSSLTDGAVTTNRSTNGIADGTGSFVAGEQEEANGVIEDRQLTASNFTEHVWALIVDQDDNSNAETLHFRMTLNGGNPGMTNSVTPVITISKPHTLLANDVESASEVTKPAVGQTHGLLANDVESASEVSQPTLLEVVPLLAEDVESASEVTKPTIGQTHALLANDTESASEVSQPAVGQTHVLLANDVESASEVSVPTATESNILLAEDVESASEVSSPAVGQVHVLLANDVESNSELTKPALTEVGGGTDALLADDVESASEVTSPAIGQVHVLLASDVESASGVSVPSLGGADEGHGFVHPGGGAGKEERRKKRTIYRPRYDYGDAVVQTYQIPEPQGEMVVEVSVEPRGESAPRKKAEKASSGTIIGFLETRGAQTEAKPMPGQFYGIPSFPILEQAKDDDAALVILMLLA